MPKFSLFSFTAALLFAFQAFAFTPPSLEYQTMPSGKYVLDTAHATILFKIKHLGYSWYIGRFNKFSGTLDFNANDIELSKTSISIDPNSIDTNNKVLEKKLVSKEFFNVPKFPNMIFKSTRVEKTSNDSGKLYGDLTMMGVTKPIQLDVTFNGGGTNTYANTKVLGFSATGKIKRSDWGMSMYIPDVADEVALEIHAEFDNGKSDVN